MTRILGIDPGSRVTGFGVIDVIANQISYVASGCIRADDAALAGRLKVIYDGVYEVVASYQPDETVIENIFMHRNASSALKLGQARGAAICALASHSLPIHEYSPNQIKQAVVGRGHASKDQVQHMVQALLKLTQSPQADAADALACAICHNHSSQTLARLSSGVHAPEDTLERAR